MQKPFFVWQDRKLQKINPEDVAVLSIEKNYTRIFLADASAYMVRTPLSNALKKLPRDMFIKTHRSIAVSIDYIDSIYRDHLNLVIADARPVPIAKRYYKSVIEKLNIIE